MISQRADAALFDADWHVPSLICDDLMSESMQIVMFQQARSYQIAYTNLDLFRSFTRDPRFDPKVNSGWPGS